MRLLPPARRGSRLAVFALPLALFACGDDGARALPDGGADAAPDARPVPGEIADFLATVPGLTAVEETTRYSGYRRFMLEYEQPVDHDDPGGATFVQRAVLLHRDRDAPFVLYTSGYNLFSVDYLAELSVGMSADQLAVEQRFFPPSTPQPTTVADWDFVRIRQAAADHHRWVEALRPYYRGAWLSTGHSKGGMTSVYHRRFYPDDVDATVAYVAPISFAAGDDRYHAFFDQVADADCRQRLIAFQRDLLGRREAMKSRIDALGLSFTRYGGDLDAVLEDAVTELPWSFFQYGSLSDCATIPGAAASDDAEFQYLLQRNGFGDDDSMEPFLTYYYQAEAELGYPSMPTAAIDDLLEVPDGFEADDLPAGVSVTYDPAAMKDIDAWVKEQGERLLFVYGDSDPWYGGAFALGPGSADCFELVVPGANHGALVRDLPAADQTIALDAVERWTGVRPALFTGRFAAAVEPPPETRLHLRLPVR